MSLLFTPHGSYWTPGLALAELFHAPDPSCIVFAANATMALNTVLNGVLHPGDHVITTVCEHNSVLRPLYRLRAQGVGVSFTGVDNAARLCYDQWEALLRPTTRALVVTGASNVTGNGTDLARAADFAHRHGLLFIVDAAQTAGAQPIDVQRLGIDALCFTGHKALLGPQGHRRSLRAPRPARCAAPCWWQRRAQL